MGHSSDSRPIDFKRRLEMPNAFEWAFEWALSVGRGHG